MINLKRVRTPLAILMLLSTNGMATQPVLAGSLNKGAVVNYARRNWNVCVWNYPYYPNDCTNFASQCLKAGGWADSWGYYTWDSAWWFEHNTNKASRTWTSSNSLFNFLRSSGRGSLVSDCMQLEPGDLVQCDWGDGTGGPDGTIDHTAVVTSKGYGPGSLYLTQHSNNRLDQGIWVFWNAAPRGRFYYWHLKNAY